MSASKRANFRALLSGPTCASAGSVWDPISARIADKLGVQVGLMGGSLGSYAVLGAQRNTKLLGIFRRLAHRDGKTAYLAHIPRIWRYLERNLRHPALADLAAWFDTHFPPAGRERKS